MGKNPRAPRHDHLLAVGTVRVLRQAVVAGKAINTWQQLQMKEPRSNRVHSAWLLESQQQHTHLCEVFETGHASAHSKPHWDMGHGTHQCRIQPADWASFEPDLQYCRSIIRSSAPGHCPMMGHQATCAVQGTLTPPPHGHDSRLVTSDRPNTAMAHQGRRTMRGVGAPFHVMRPGAGCCHGQE